MKLKQLEELEGKRAAVQERVNTAFTESKMTPDGQDGNTVYDFTKVKVYGSDMSTTAVAEKVKADMAEMNEMGAAIDALRDVKASYDELQKPSQGMVHPSGEESKGNGLPSMGERRESIEEKSLGEQIVAHEGFKAMNTQQGQKKLNIELPNIGLKALFQTSAGWSPESVRSGRLVDAVTRPIQLLDLIPSGSIDQAAAVWMEETTRTHNSAEKAEGAAYAESEFELTEQSQTVRKITDSIPVTDEQLEDVSFAQSYLDMRIRFGVRQRLDNQVLNGDGIAPNLEGILNKSGIQTQAKGADPVPDAIFKAMTLIQVTGRASPSGVVIHPTDWQGVRLLRTADGIYIWGNPSESGPMRIWGLPVVSADVIAENTALVGDFANFCQLLEKRGLTVEVGYVGTQFTEGKQTIRASLRSVMVIYRAAAYCTVTGI